MKNPRNCWTPRVLVSTIAVLASLYLGYLAQPAQAIQITSPKPNARLRGTVQVLAAPTQDEQFNYATLSIDKSGRNLTNVVPIKFQFDTTKFPDGPHKLQVELSDGFSVIATSQAVPVFIMNAMTNVNELPGGSNKVPALPVPMNPVPAAPFTKETPAPAKHVQAAKPTPAPRVAATTPKSMPTIAATSRPIVLSTPVAVGVGSTALVALKAAPTILLDGQPISFSIAPVIENGRTMLILRPLVEASGGELSWDATAKQAVAIMKDRKVAFTSGRNTVLVDGQPVTLEHPVTIIMGRVLIPATAWKGLFGGSVNFDPQTRNVWLRSYEALVRAKIAQ